MFALGILLPTPPFVEMVAARWGVAQVGVKRCHRIDVEAPAYYEDGNFFEVLHVGVNFVF